jgi:hypothetical protein
MPTYVGELGQAFFSAMSTRLKTSPHYFLCDTYDGFWHFAYGLDAAVRKGDNYEDADVLWKWMRA